MPAALDSLPNFLECTQEVPVLIILLDVLAVRRLLQRQLADVHQPKTVERGAVLPPQKATDGVLSIAFLDGTGDVPQGCSDPFPRVTR